MKKSIVFFFSMCMTLFLVGCMGDPYADKRPYDYGDAKWVCESPNIYFVVDTSHEDYYNESVGEIEIDGNMYPCTFGFIHQTNQVWVNIFADNLLSLDSRIGELHGDCDFSEDSLTIHIDTKLSTVWNGKYESITLDRLDLTK